MTSFDDRQRAYEKKFALDEELRFKATARRNKLLGRWAAEKIGLSGIGNRSLRQGCRYRRLRGTR